MSIDEAIRRIEEDLAVLKRARAVMARCEPPEKPKPEPSPFPSLTDPIGESCDGCWENSNYPQDQCRMSHTCGMYAETDGDDPDHGSSDDLATYPTPEEAAVISAAVAPPGPPVAVLSTPMAVIPAGDTERLAAWKERPRDRCHVTLLDPDDLLSQPVAGEAQS